MVSDTSAQLLCIFAPPVPVGDRCVTLPDQRIDAMLVCPFIGCFI